MNNLFKTFKKTLMITSLTIVIAYTFLFIWKFRLLNTMLTDSVYLTNLIFTIIVVGLSYVIIVVNFVYGYIMTIGANRESLIKFYGKNQFINTQQIIFLITSIINCIIFILSCLIYFINNQLMYYDYQVIRLNEINIKAFVIVIILFISISMYLLNNISYAKDIYFNNQLKYAKSSKRIIKCVTLSLRTITIFISSFLFLNINEINNAYQYNNVTYSYASESLIILVAIPVVLAIVSYIEYKNFYLEEVCL